MNRTELLRQQAGPMPPFIKELREKIRKGIKTHTRRVIKPQPHQDENKHWFLGSSPEGFGEHGIPDYMLHRCPYQAGEIRYLREPLVRDGRGLARYEDDDALVFGPDGEPVVWRWKLARLSQIFLPKELARTFVRLNGIRGERVQTISAVDVLAEGITERFLGEAQRGKQLVGRFETLWDTINRTRGFGWDLNPWVWVLVFELVSLDGGQNWKEPKP